MLKTVMHASKNTTSRPPLRALRQAQHLSLDELGRRTGIERTRLGRAERGYTQLRADELERVAAELNIPVSKLTTPSTPTV